MNWFIRTLNSSIGKKQIMALSGLFFCGFLCVHLIGNLFIYGGRDLFNAYVSHLHSLEIMIKAAEFGLAGCAIIHVCTAILLYIQNLNARPEKYVVYRAKGGRTIASATMPYTGMTILVFVIIHLISFKLTDHTHQTVFDIVTTTLSNASFFTIYLIGVMVVVFHTYHGVWSACQTLGLNHPKYNPFIIGSRLIYSVILGFGFGLIPFYIILTT